ncbi:MAG: glycosyltransferase [Cyclobacteriaceae bacterium]|nr:MAG: glycosyltransferase [Cyclobacteriaceae bacterium]
MTLNSSTMSADGKNILMIIPNLDFGGAQRSFCSLANGLYNRHNVYICVFNAFDGIAYDFQPKVTDLGIPAGRTFFSKIYSLFLRYRSIYRLKKQLNIDTSISYLEGANFLNVLTCRRDRLILSVRGSKYHDPNIKGLTGYLRRKILIPVLYKFADTVVALNKGIERELVQRFGLNPERVKVIRNFYDIALIENLSNQPLENQYQFITESKYIMYSGRLAPEKGLKPVIDCFHHLLAKMPNLKLLMVGDGPIRSDLTHYAKMKGMMVSNGNEPLLQSAASQIYFLGYQDNPYNFLKNASLLLIGSKSEGGPNILFEAMICGTLVISTDCPYGPREIIAGNLKKEVLETSYEGDHGVLLPMLKDENNGEVREWVLTVERYINDVLKANRITARAKKHASQYTAEKILPHWEKIV